MSRRSTAIPLITAAVLTALGIAAVAGLDRRDLAFNPSVHPRHLVARLEPGERACQRRIEREASFDVAEVAYVSLSAERPAAGIAVHDSATGRVLARGVRGGRPSGGAVATRLRPALGDGAPFDLCVTNLGPGPLGLAGNRELAPLSDFAEIPRGRRADGRFDIAVAFRRTEPKSTLSQLPTVFERASVFRPLGAWVYWALLAALLIGVPALLWRAIDAAR